MKIQNSNSIFINEGDSLIVNGKEIKKDDYLVINEVEIVKFNNLENKRIKDHQVEIFNEVFRERFNQDLKWGVQNHDPFAWSAILSEEVGEMNKAILDSSTLIGGKFAISPNLLSSGKDCYRQELIQIAAVAISMIECLDRGEWW